ncbi:hypothetical protein ACFE04_006049 [Oxalis oulophora]
MMNESNVKTSSCLAITTTTDKHQQHRQPSSSSSSSSSSGGCVARAKQASKRFAVDDKMPKIKPHYLTKEKNSVVKGKIKIDMDRKHDIMKTPGLVARLMGLESMPTTVQPDRTREAEFSRSYDVIEEKVSSFSCSVGSGEGSSLEKESTTRPQKIRKTEPSERRAVTRFCTESLQIKNVLQRSRKHRHPKLLSPEKSPRISSSRSSYRTSRLIDAATKILEPGLQNRAKCALTYRSSANYAQKDELLMEEIVLMSPHLMDESGCARESIIGQTSCNNNGSFLSVVDSQQKFDKEPFVYQALAIKIDNCPELGKNKLRTSISLSEQDGEVLNKKSRDRPAQERDNKCSRSESSPERKPSLLEDSVQCHSTKLPKRLHKDEPASVKHKAQTQNQIFLSRDRVPPRPNSSDSKSKRVSSTAIGVNRSKDFVAPRRSISGPTLTKVDNSSLRTQKRSSGRQDESLSYCPKRRTVGANRVVESVDSTMTKQTTSRCDLTSGGKTRVNSHPKVNRANNKGENKVNSFTFSSSSKHKSRVSTQKEKTKVYRDLGSKVTSHCRPTVSSENKSNEQKLLQQKVSFKADALGVLLQQKLKELTSQEEDELTIGSIGVPKRSTAMILQELISALKTEQLDPQDGNMDTRDIVFQNKVKTEGNVVESSFNGGDHLSPGSVLEASFSNCSCFSSSVDDNSVSGHRVPFDSMDCSCDPLLDSAISPSKDASGYKFISQLLNQISATLDNIKSTDIGIGLSGSKLMHAKAVILDAEIMFANITQETLNGEKHLLVGPTLLDTLAETLSIDWNSHLGFKEDNQMKGFLFDCIIEYLDCKCCQYYNSRFDHLPCSNSRFDHLPCTNSDMLIRDFGIEFRKWTEYASMIPNDLIECEMHHSFEKSATFHPDGFETGIEIDEGILQVLVEEIVLDLL